MKRITLPCEPFDFDGLEAFFEEKARRGFAPHSLEGLHAVFERGETAPVLYRVDYCDSADLDNMLQRYSALGWEYVLGGPDGRAVFRAAQGEKPLRIGCVPEEIAEKANNVQARDYRLYADLFLLVFTAGLVAAFIYLRDGHPATLLRFVCQYLFGLVWWVTVRIQYGKRRHTGKDRRAALILATAGALACSAAGCILLFWGDKIFPAH